MFKTIKKYFFSLIIKIKRKYSMYMSKRLSDKLEKQFKKNVKESFTQKFGDPELVISRIKALDTVAKQNYPRPINLVLNNKEYEEFLLNELKTSANKVNNINNPKAPLFYEPEVVDIHNEMIDGGYLNGDENTFDDIKNRQRNQTLEDIRLINSNTKKLVNSGYEDSFKKIFGKHIRVPRSDKEIF